MLRTTSLGSRRRTNSFPTQGGKKGSVASQKRINLNSDIEDEEKNIGLEPVEPVELGIRWLDDSIKISKISVQLNEDQIFQAATDYQSWTNGHYVYENLPRFDDSTLSGLTLEDENSMIKKEIAKYAKFASSEKPSLFKSNGIFGTANRDGFKDLAKVIDQIRAHLQIVRHDNYLLILEHIRRYDFYMNFKGSRDFIRERYQRDHGTIQIKGREPKKLDDEANNTKIYHILIDFVFNCTAWWLMHVAKSDSWNAHVIAVMARWAVKLKFIALDPVHWVEKSLAKGEGVIRQIKMEEEDDDIMSVELSNVGSKEGTRKVIFPDNPNLVRPYYESKSHFRDILLDLVLGVLNSLSTGLQGSNSTSLSVRNLIYRGGLDRTLRQLAVHQDSQISTMSDREEFRYGHTAFQLLVMNSQSIANCEPEAPNVTNVCWHHIVVGEASPVYRVKGEKRTDSLDDIISLLVPLGFMENWRIVEPLYSAVAWTIAQKDLDSQNLDHPNEETLELEFSISTPKKIEMSSVNNTDTIPSSQSPLFTGLEEEMKPLKEHRNLIQNQEAIDLRRKALDLFNEYKRGKSEQDSWTISEDTIRVKTTKYSTVVLTVAIVIILGSLCVPFLVGEKIKGVDPFQFVTFAWLLSGAFLVGAKSRYVEEWPWHDFLRGQIICRSVSELAHASRLKEQIILLYLLQNEFKKPLKFRGAFDGPFSQRHDVETGRDAFNIDVALDHAAALAAGFIVLKIWDKEGSHLLLHDSRSDVAYDYNLVYKGFESNQVNDGKKGDSRERQGRQGSEILKLERDNFSYYVLGQYVKDCQFG